MENSPIGPLPPIERRVPCALCGRHPQCRMQAPSVSQRAQSIGIPIAREVCKWDKKRTWTCVAWDTVDSDADLPVPRWRQACQRNQPNKCDLKEKTGLLGACSGLWLMTNTKADPAPFLYWYHCPLLGLRGVKIKLQCTAVGVQKLPFIGDCPETIKQPSTGRWLTINCRRLAVYHWPLEGNCQRLGLDRSQR